jgi:hypothetical protein
LYKTAPLKNPWDRFGHVEIYNKIDYFWNFEYAVFYKMVSGFKFWLYYEYFLSAVSFSMETLLPVTRCNLLR